MFSATTTVCYAIVLSGRKSGFRAGFRPDSSRESLKIGPPAGGPILRLSQLESGRIKPGSPISNPEALLRNVRYMILSGAHRPEALLHNIGYARTGMPVTLVHPGPGFTRAKPRSNCLMLYNVASELEFVLPVRISAGFLSRKFQHRP